MDGISFWQDGNKISDIDFGTVPAGSEKKVSVAVVNDGDDELVDLSFWPESEQVKVLKFPLQLRSHETGEMLLSYTPPEDVIIGLSTRVNVKGFYLRRS
jgi:hypothetical protein